MDNYAIGEVIKYQPYGGAVRTVIVAAREADIKNGRPGFSGTQIEPAFEYNWQAAVWGYDSQIISISWRPTTPILGSMP